MRLLPLLALFGCTAAAPLPTPSAPRAPSYFESVNRAGGAVVALVLEVDESGELRSFCAGAHIGRGYILTAAHCVVDFEELGQGLPLIQWRSGEVSTAVTLSIDTDVDLAVMRASDAGPFLEIGPRPEVGDPAAAVGHPLGLTWSVTFGRVSAVRDAGGEYEIPHAWVQYDGGVGPGNSGGPLLDRRGRLIGVASFLIYDGHLGGFVSPYEVRAFLDRSEPLFR